jgi:hypothetical protein
MSIGPHEMAGHLVDHLHYNIDYMKRVAGCSNSIGGLLAGLLQRLDMTLGSR